MADIIKKISAFKELEAPALEGNEFALVARDGKNYKVSFDAIYNATDLRMSNGSLTLQKIADWTNQNFASQQYVSTYVATKQEVNELVHDATTAELDTLNNIVRVELPEWVNKRIGEDIDWVIHHINDFAPNLAYDMNVYTKDETQQIVHDMIESFEEEMHNAYHGAINNMVQDIERLGGEVEELTDTVNTFEDMKNLVDNTIKVDGDGTLLLGNDGKYHDIGELELVSYGDILLDNTSVDENNILHANIRIPALPKTHTLHFNIKLPYSTVNQTYAKGVKIWSEFNKFEKKWFDERTMFKVAFDNNVLQFKEKHTEEGVYENLIKSRTYFDEDEVKDTLSIRTSHIDILHTEYNANVEIQLTDKLPENCLTQATITYHIFADMFK